VLIVGLGGIGVETARLFKALGARVLGVKRTVEPVEHVDEVHPVTALPTLAAVSDAIVVTLPGTAATDGIIGRQVLQAAKPGVVVVNVGRGTTIDEAALIEALESGQVSSAYLDVFATEPLPPESPLWAMGNVVLSPHTAALNSAEDRRIAELFADNLRRFLNGRPLRNSLDTNDFY
jgi:phosphoglycerate dehydrogenase-like enzyme